MGPPVDFGLPVLIIRVLEAWELGKGGLYRKYRSYKKIMKISKFDLVPGVQKNNFYDFSAFFTRKIQNTGISSETTIPRISSETAAPCYHVVTEVPCYGFLRRAEEASSGETTWESRVRRRRLAISSETAAPCEKRQRRAGSYRQTKFST